MKAHRQGRGITVLLHNLGTRRVWVVSTMPRPLRLLERDPVPIVQEAGWAAGLIWMGVESLAHKGVQTQYCPAHSRSLFCLCYPGCLITEWDSMVVNYKTPQPRMGLTWYSHTLIHPLFHQMFLHS